MFLHSFSPFVKKGELQSPENNRGEYNYCVALLHDFRNFERRSRDSVSLSVSRGWFYKKNIFSEWKMPSFFILLCNFLEVLLLVSTASYLFCKFTGDGKECA